MLFITQEEEINLNQPLQVLYFYSAEMPFHAKLVHSILQLQEKYKEINFSAVDVNYFSNQCIRFSVTSVPTLLAFKNGKEIKRIKDSVRSQDLIGVFADIYTL